jgi:DNA-directed RNA polymerase subunit RPC12/RpoP
MSDETKKVKKEELTDQQVEKATGGSSIVCRYCHKTINYIGTPSRTCPYCGKSILGGQRSQ